MLHNDELNSSGNGNISTNNNNKLCGGMHIKTEDSASSSGDMSGVENSLNNSNFGSLNSSGPGSGGRQMMSQTSPERIQPLPSNVVNKQSNSMDVSA